MARQEYAVIAPRRIPEGKMESGVMKRLTVRARHGVSGSVAFAVASFFLLWPFARLDFDRHHDGYMLAQAIAVHQGASVHTEVFAQYGPVTLWLHSLALFLPMGPALALRAGMPRIRASGQRRSQLFRVGQCWGSCPSRASTWDFQQWRSAS